MDLSDASVVVIHELMLGDFICRSAGNLVVCPVLDLGASNFEILMMQPIVSR